MGTRDVSDTFSGFVCYVLKIRPRVGSSLRPKKHICGAEINFERINLMKSEKSGSKDLESVIYEISITDNA